MPFPSPLASVEISFTLAPVSCHRLRTALPRCEIPPWKIKGVSFVPEWYLRTTAIPANPQPPPPWAPPSPQATARRRSRWGLSTKQRRTFGNDGPGAARIPQEGEAPEDVPDAERPQELALLPQDGVCRGVPHLELPAAHEVHGLGPMALLHDDPVGPVGFQGHAARQLLPDVLRPPTSKGWDFCFCLNKHWTLLQQSGIWPIFMEKAITKS